MIMCLSIVTGELQQYTCISWFIIMLNWTNDLENEHNDQLNTKKSILNHNCNVTMHIWHVLNIFVQLLCETIWKSSAGEINAKTVHRKYHSNIFFYDTLFRINYHSQNSQFLTIQRKSETCVVKWYNLEQNNYLAHVYCLCQIKVRSSIQASCSYKVTYMKIIKTP